MKTNKKYYFSVDGETEEWYFKHLKRLINQTEEAKFTVDFVIKPKKSPLSVLKTISLLSSSEEAIAFHICDYESNEDVHVKKFYSTLDELEQIRTECETIKCIKEYRLGYSNFTFDLWIALHKKQCLSSVVDRHKYVKIINSAFGTKFIYIDEYKKENNFKQKILSKINIQDVIFAIKNAEKIKENNEEIRKQLIEYKGFEYYKDNPDLTINEVVKRILSDCKIKV